VTGENRNLLISGFTCFILSPETVSKAEICSAKISLQLIGSGIPKFFLSHTFSSVEE
jgi:hypothetical protein